MQRFLHTTSRHYKQHKLLFTHVAKGNVSGETTSVTVHLLIFSINYKRRVEMIYESCVFHTICIHLQNIPTRIKTHNIN